MRSKRCAVQNQGITLSLIPGRRNVVLFEVYYCALPFDNLTSLVRLVAEDG